jgi:hypothetical protein
MLLNRDITSGEGTWVGFSDVHSFPLPTDPTCGHSDTSSDHFLMTVALGALFISCHCAQSVTGR